MEQHQSASMAAVPDQGRLEEAAATRFARGRRLGGWSALEAAGCMEDGGREAGAHAGATKRAEAGVCSGRLSDWRGRQSGIDSGGLIEGGGGRIELADVSGRGAREVEREEFGGRMTCGAVDPYVLRPVAGRCVRIFRRPQPCRGAKLVLSFSYRSNSEPFLGAGGQSPVSPNRPTK
jgi:hypothetical protein